MSEQLKLTLTSQALEKLIGGNEPAAIEVRQGIAAEFAKRYLKGVVEESVKKEIEVLKNEARSIARKVIQEELAIKDWGNATYIYLPSGSGVYQAIAKTVKDELRNVIASLVTEHLKEVNLEKLVDIRAKIIVDDTVNFEIKKIVKEKIQEAMNKV